MLNISKCIKQVKPQAAVIKEEIISRDQFVYEAVNVESVTVLEPPLDVRGTAAFSASTRHVSDKLLWTLNKSDMIFFMILSKLRSR